MSKSLFSARALYWLLLSSTLLFENSSNFFLLDSRQTQLPANLSVCEFTCLPVSGVLRLQSCADANSAASNVDADGRYLRYSLFFFLSAKLVPTLHHLFQCEKEVH